MRIRTRHRKKGMTALQAAILTGVSIAVALIVGYWIWTVVVGSIRTERLSLTIPSAEYYNDIAQDSGISFDTLTGSGWVVTLRISNNGPSDATIIDIRINGKSITTYSNGEVEVRITVGEGQNAETYTWVPEPSQDQNENVPIKAGSQATVELGLSTNAFRSGQTIEVAFVTAANQVYTSSIALP